MLALHALAIALSLATGLGMSMHQTRIATQNAQRAEAVQQFLLGVFDAPTGNYESTLVVPVTWPNVRGCHFGRNRKPGSTCKLRSPG